MNIKNLRKSKSYKEMSIYIACSIIEGFSGEENTQEDIATAWQYLIDTGECWKLQGFYGRTAMSLLEQGLLLKPIKQHKDYYGHDVPSIGA